MSFDPCFHIFAAPKQARLPTREEQMMGAVALHNFGHQASGDAKALPNRKD